MPHWVRVASVLAVIARVLQGSGHTDFVQPSLPPRLPLHAHVRPKQKMGKGRSGAPKIWQHPGRSSRTARRFWWLLELPVVTEATALVVEATSAFASATEGCLGLGALSADIIGGFAECGIASEVAAGFELPSFLTPVVEAAVGAVEADWLAAIGANVLGRVETGALADAAVAKLESSGAGAMIALSEEKQVEFACGILSRVPPAKVAEFLQAMLLKVAQNPSLLSQMEAGSPKLLLTICQESPQAREVFLILLQKVATTASPALLVWLAKLAVEAIPAEQLLAPVVGTPIVETLLASLPPENLVELGRWLVTEASEPVLRQVWPLFLSQAPPEVLSSILQSSPEAWGVLTKTASEVAREAAESALQMPGLAVKLPPVDEYDLQMLVGSAFLTLENSTRVGRNATAPKGQSNAGVIKGGGKVVVGLLASLALKQAAFCVGLGQFPFLWVFGLGASSVAREIYEQNL